MNERHDDLREIIDAALREMAAEEGDGFDPQACNLAEFYRKTGLARSRARTIRAHGKSGRRAASGVLAGHTGLVNRRPPAKGRHQLAGDIRAAARLGLRRRPHHGEDLHLGDGGHKGAVHALVALDHGVREEAAGAELRGAKRQRADAGDEAALPVAVAAVSPATAQVTTLFLYTLMFISLNTLYKTSCAISPR